MAPNVVVAVADDLDLERLPSYPQTDAGARQQLELHLRRPACSSRLAQCNYTAPNIESIGSRGVLFLGAHVPASVCTPSRYSVLTGRLPSSSPFFSGTLLGRRDDQVSISWNTYLEHGGGKLMCCGPGIEKPCSAPRVFGCRRRASTLGGMLQSAGFFTGFVGKWHVSSTPAELLQLHQGGRGKISVAQEQAGRVASLNELLTSTREQTLLPLVRAAGFNFSGAVSVGNVMDLDPIGLNYHNLDWEAEAALRFLSLASGHVAAGRVAAFYLHFCTTLTHSPGPTRGICADPRLCQAGLLNEVAPYNRSLPVTVVTKPPPPRSSGASCAPSSPISAQEGTKQLCESGWTCM